jgi:endonuclease/exonuclease/phosphatase family metal-dependent hydrolase
MVTNLSCAFGIAIAMLRVATYNLLAHPYTRFQTGTGVVETPEQQGVRDARTKARIEALGADVLLLQEHDRSLDLELPFGVRAFAYGRHEGCSVLFTRAPTTTFRSFTVDLRHGKAAAVAEMDGVLYVSVHLKGGPGAKTKADRKAQVALLLQSLPTESPCVMAGDMNDQEPDETFGDLLSSAGFVRAPYDGFSAFTSDLSWRVVLDHMYVRGAALTHVHVPFAVENPWAAGATSGSDHAAVVADLCVCVGASADADVRDVAHCVQCDVHTFGAAVQRE